MSQIRADLNLNCARFLAAIKTVDSAIAGLEHNVVGFVAGFKGLQVVGEAIESQFEHLKQSFELGAKLREMSLNTEQTVSDMLLLRQVFENAGMGADFSEQAIFNLNKSLAGVNEQGEATKPVFDKLGLSIQALRSLSTVDQLKMIGDAMREIQNPADRAKAACDLFGKSGKRMMQIFGEEKAFAIAGTQIGELGQTMEENARTFKEIEDEMGALTLKVQQFYAGIAEGSSGQLNETLESLRGADLSELGESIGGVITNALKLGKVLWELKPILIGIAAAMTANSLANSKWGAAIQLFSTNAVGGLSKYLETFGLAVYQLRVANQGMTTLGAVGRVTFSSLAAGARGLLAALGPVGIALMLGTAAYQAIAGRADRINNATGAVKSIGQDQTSQTKQNFAVLANVSSETEREKAAETLAKQLEEVHEKMRQIDEDFSDEKGFDDAGRAQIVESYNRQAQAIELQARSLSRIPPGLLAARAAAKVEAEALEDARKKAEALTEEVAKAREAMQGDIAKAAFEELSPEDQKTKTLNDVGENSAKDIEEEIAALDGLIDRKKQEGQATDEELRRQKQLIAARIALIAIEKAIGHEKEQAAKKAEADAKKADEDKKKKSEQDANFNRFEREWQLELQKTQAEINGDDATVKRVEHQQRVDRYEKQATEAGEDPAKAHQMAEKRAKAEEDLEKKKHEKGSESGPAVSHLQRIGGGGNQGVGTADPLLREAQRQTRAIEEQTRSQNEMTRVLRDAKDKPVNVKLVPVFGGG